MTISSSITLSMPAHNLNLWMLIAVVLLLQTHTNSPLLQTNHKLWTWLIANMSESDAEWTWGGHYLYSLFLFIYHTFVHFLTIIWFYYYFTSDWSGWSRRLMKYLEILTITSRLIPHNIDVYHSLEIQQIAISSAKSGYQ